MGVGCRKLGKMSNASMHMLKRDVASNRPYCMLKQRQTSVRPLREAEVDISIFHAGVLGTRGEDKAI